MFNFIKNNKLYILFLIIIIVIIVNATISYGNEFKKRIDSHNNICSEISNNPDKHLDIKIDCNRDIRLSIMGNYRQASNNSMTILFNYGIPIMIIILIGIYFGSRYASGYFKYELMRDNYHSVLKKHIINSYIKSIILPITGIIILISFAFISNTTPVIDLYGYYDSDALAVPEFYIDKVCLYYALFIFNLFLFGIFISNLYLIVSKKIKNIITSIFTSYILLNIIEIFLSNAVGVGVAYFAYYVFEYENAGTLIDYFNPLMVWKINFLEQPIFLTLTLFILVLITGILVWRIYSNKESVVIDSEK